MKFHENPSSGNRDVLCGRMDGRTDMTKVIVAVRKFANALRNLMHNFYSLLWQEMDFIVLLIPNVYVFPSYLLEVFCFLYKCACQTKDASDWLNFHYIPASCHQEYGTEFEVYGWLSRDGCLCKSSCLCLCTIFQTELPTFLKKRQVATACFSCSPPDLNFLDPYFVFMLSLFHIYVHA
jgi:hypothetical protein